MEYNYFMLNRVQYIIDFRYYKLEVLKKENDLILSLNEEETVEIYNLLNNKTGYEYDSDILTNIINSNSQLENREYLQNFLQWLENIIPVDCRENFYTNLSSLCTNLNLNIDFSELVSESSKMYETVGGYNTRNNSLEVNKNSMLKTWEIAGQTSNPEEFFWKSYSLSLLHEFSHMASSKYDKDTEISLCGFDKYPPEKQSDKNRGLTEGFTEIIAMAGVPGTIEISSGYYIEASIINQMIQLIGIDVFLKSYFSNLGTTLLEDELRNIISDEKKSFELFRNIEVNFQIRDLNEKQNILGNIQLSLIDYLDKKCEYLVQIGDTNSIGNILNIYEQMLVTPDKLKIMLKNPDNYEGVKESLLRFNSIKQKYDYLTNNVGLVNHSTK